MTHPCSEKHASEEHSVRGLVERNVLSQNTEPSWSRAAAGVKDRIPRLMASSVSCKIWLELNHRALVSPYASMKSCEATSLCKVPRYAMTGFVLRLFAGPEYEQLQQSLDTSACDMIYSSLRCQRSTSQNVNASRLRSTHLSLYTI